MILISDVYESWAIDVEIVANRKNDKIDSCFMLYLILVSDLV